MSSYSREDDSSSQQIGNYEGVEGKGSDVTVYICGLRGSKLRRHGERLFLVAFSVQSHQR